MSGRGLVLVTGFPGMRAKALARVVLGDPEERPLALLVHPRRRAAADSALAALAPRVAPRVIEGDPAAIDFGLARGPYRALLEEVVCLHHAYQVLDLAAPAELARTVNVGGAREVIEFSRAAERLGRVIHHSSVFVSGDRTGVVLESELHARQSFRSPVAASLALSEAMLKRHPEVPLTVARASQIVGDSRTGITDRLDGPYPVLAFLLGVPSDTVLPLPPRLNAPLHLVPVNYVARAAYHLGDLPATLGATLHLVDSAPLTTRRFIELAAAHFGKRLEDGFHAGSFGRSLFNNPGVGLLAQKLRAVQNLVMRNVVYDAASAVAGLAGSGITCPPLESYLDVLLAHVEERAKERGLTEPPPKEAVDAAS